MKEYKSVFAREIGEFITFKKGLGYKVEGIVGRRIEGDANCKLKFHKLSL